jgi:hypothetical protein
MSRTTPRAALLPLLAACLALSACSKPEVPEHDDPPEPQAAAAQPAELTQAIQQPLDKAHAAQDATAAASAAQDAAIGAATQDAAGN